MATSASPTVWQRLRSMVLQRCPRCRRGRVFASVATMNVRCPVCDLHFEREPGYFIGSMYISYGFSAALLFALTMLVRWVLPDLDLGLCLLIAVVLYLPVVPVTWRYSRLVWMYFDHAAWPDSA